MLSELYFEQAFEAEIVASFAQAGFLFCLFVFATAKRRVKRMSAGIRGLVGAASMMLVIFSSYAYSSLHGRTMDLGDLIFLFAMTLPSGLVGFAIPLERALTILQRDA